jgi:predicted RNase H-like HicB family nuclease
MATVIYSVSVWREPEGTWSASADDIDGAFTDGDSLSEIDRNIRESIAVTLDLPRGAEATMTVELHVRVSDDADELVSTAVRAREAAARSPELTAAAVRSLRDKGLSTRDIARLLGITHGRVGQLSAQKSAA